MLGGRPKLGGYQLGGVCQSACWDETRDAQRNEGVLKKTTNHVSQTSRGMLGFHLQVFVLLFYKWFLDSPLSLLSVQETFRSTSWPVCCRGTGWTCVWRALRRRWASTALEALSSSVSGREISSATAWRPTGWFLRTIHTTFSLKVRRNGLQEPVGYI